jgi:ankyrin repeat protein
VDGASSTALHHSLRNKHTYLAKHILDRPELIDRPDEEGNTALQLAVECGEFALVEKVLDLRRVSLLISIITRQSRKGFIASCSVQEWVYQDREAPPGSWRKHQ